MTQELHVDLIDGQFSAEDARELLIDLFSRKTNFHEIRNFSSKERFGKEDHRHVNRIAKLTKNKQQLIQFFNELEKFGKRISIKSMVEIKVTDEVPAEMEKGVTA